MGIPSFFRKILNDNVKIIEGMTGEDEFDYFFIDFNSIIYYTYNKICTEVSIQDEQVIHKELIRTTISFLEHMINDVIKPKKYAFISVDGVAPRAKMVQQRSRRYKSVQLKKILREKRHELNEKAIIDWDPSPNICPGTIFMSKLNKEIKNAMKKKRFTCRVYLSDSTHPGEGEHKFLKIMRDLQANEASRNDRVAVYSPDGDMISLSLLTHKKNVKIVRIPDKNNVDEEKYCQEFEFISLDLNRLRDQFCRLMTATYDGFQVDELKILNDYNFLLMLVGNDFVVSLPFLKIKSGGLDFLIKAYNEIIHNLKQHLVLYDFEKEEYPRINLVFFRLILQKLAQVEGYQMKKIYEQADRNDSRRKKLEGHMSPYMIFESRFQHVCFFHADHPEYFKYAPLLSKIDYSQPKHVWKDEFYSFFAKDVKRSDMVINYFESLKFTLFYYLKGCPCYDWHYRYRVSPLPSDMLLVMEGLDINSLSFSGAPPVLPFEQLMLILPPQMHGLLPKCLGDLMLNGELQKYYPQAFEVDALAGLKYIYSEALLPDIDLDEIRIRMSNCILNEEEKGRNKNFEKIYLSK